MLMRPMGIGDCLDVVSILNKNRMNLAFEDWENKVLTDHATGVNTNVRSLLHIVLGEPLGLVLFGVSEGNASINHLWVADSQRGKGVSKQLLNATLQECAGTIVHAITVSGNTQANDFFSREGFTLGQNFWELDIESATGQICDDVCLSAHVHILGLRGLLHSIPIESEWQSIKRALFAKGIRRIHFIPPLGFDDDGRLIEMGFQKPKGETLWIKTV